MQDIRGTTLLLDARRKREDSNGEPGFFRRTSHG